MPSLPPVSAKVIADAEQFVAEFRRAERAAKGSTGAIEREVGTLSTRLAKKFSLGDIGKDMLKGLGIGSGFALAEQASKMIVGYWERTAEAAKQAEQTTARLLELTLKGISAKQTEEQKLVAAIKARDALEKEMKAAMVKKQVQLPTSVEDAWSMIAPKEELRDLTLEEQKDADKSKIAFAEQAIVVDELNKKKKDKDVEIVIKGQTDAVQRATKSYNDWQSVLSDVDKKLESNQEEVAKLVEHYRDIADPSEKFRKEIAMVNLLLESQRIGAGEAANAIANLNQKMADAQMEHMDKVFEKDYGDLDRLANKAKKVSEAAKDIGMAFSSAFEDAVIGGDKLSNVFRSLTKDLARMALRLGVTNPLLNAAFGLDLPIFGGGKASGGSVDAGTSYLVGEKGPEIMVPRSSGTIIPNHAIADSAGGGTVQNFTYNFATGVTRQELSALLPSVVKASAGMVADRMGRGGAFRKAMA